MDILFIGGTGQISLDCVREAVNQGHNVFVFNRGNTSYLLPKNVHVICGDFHNNAEYESLLKRSFDVVCQFRVFDKEEMLRDIRLIRKSQIPLKQYIFISTVASYEKPKKAVPVTENSIRNNLNWEYCRGKFECEEVLMEQDDIPWTIVRPSQTTRDQFVTAFDEGDLAVYRIFLGKPLMLFENGESRWTVTLARQFSEPFVRLFCNRDSIHNDFHITNDAHFSWNEMYQELGKVLGVEPDVRYFSTDEIIKKRPELRGPFIEDKIHDTYFDNSKIKAVVGSYDSRVDVATYTREIMRYFEMRRGNNIEQTQHMDAQYEKLIHSLSRT